MQVTWHEHIKAELKSHHFKQSSIDPCLFIEHHVLLVLYIDDAAFFSPSAHDIDNKIRSLKQAFNLTDEGKLKDYLGICFIHHSDGWIEH